MESLVLGIASFIFGILLVVFLLWYSKLRLKQVAHNEANDLISAAEDAANDLLEEAKRRAEDYSSELQSEWEKEKERIEEKNEKYLADAEEVREQLETKQRSLQKNYDRKLNAVKKYDKVVDQFQTEFKKLRDRKRELNKEYIQKLSKISAINTQDILAELQRQILNEATTNATKFIQNSEQEAQEHSERIAKKVLNIAIFRFARAYCPERGIGYFVFKNEKEKHHILGANYEFAKIIEDVCGVDLVYNENANSLSISGFDPVRRELARASVERLMKDRYINEKRIREIVQKTKKELFRKISQDGQRIANELKLKNVNKEIKNMMGALRYRYSFTQNQYFHCAEVGFLCGLLSSELNLNIHDGRRAGVFHDIGKAMDHSLDGGHAVIGADFIQKHGENDHIVHAVRAHHFDETPSTNLAYLVIAADAISGARPGARRSTIETYAQKMNQLQVIGNSFEGVADTYVLSAGREVRVYVDSDKMSDQSALDLSQKIATKIEEECAYPGQIKVTVVRSTQAVELAR